MKRFRSRREFLFESGGGISGLALAWLLDQDGLLASDDSACSNAPAAANPMAPRKPHLPPRAKSVISLFMSGGVSHVDTFDPKPALARYAGQPLTGKGDIVVRQGNPGPLMPSPFTFRQFGQSGIEVSEIFPHIASHVDEIALIRSMYSMSNDHVQAVYALQSGVIRMGYPCESHRSAGHRPPAHGRSTCCTSNGSTQSRRHAMRCAGKSRILRCRPGRIGET